MCQLEDVSHATQKTSGLLLNSDRKSGSNRNHIRVHQESPHFRGKYIIFRNIQSLTLLRKKEEEKLHLDDLKE